MEPLETSLHARLARPRTAALAALVLLAGVALLMFVQLGGEPRGRISERRCVAVVRSMVASGDWLVPRLGDAPRLQKPPLFYWLGSATATLIGDTGPLAVRLPSAFAALGLVALVMAWGRSLLGSSAALAAGAAMLTTQLATSGRRGDAEMLLALLGVACLFCFDRAYFGRRPALLWVFGVLLGLAVLAKATAVLITIGLPIAVFLALQGELARLRDRRVVAALALALALGLAWYAAVLALVPGAFDALWHDLILPLGAADEHRGDSVHYRPPWWYIGILPIRAAPASLLLPIVLVRLWRTRVYRDDPRRRFAALAFLVPFVAFSLLPQKQKHYTLAMLPALALLCAESLGALGALGRRRLSRALLAPAGLVGLAATVLLVLFFVLIQPLPVPAVALGAALIGGLYAWAVYAGARGRALAAALALVPALTLTLTAQRVAQVFTARLEAGGYAWLSLDDRERLLRVAREHPTLVRVFQLSTQPGARDD